MTLSLSLGLGLTTLKQGTGGLTWPRLSPSSTTTDAAIGDLIGTLTMAAFGFPRLSPSSTSTDAATGDLVGTIKV